MQQENDDYRRKLQETSEIQRKISEYENRIALTTQEIERLNSIIRTKSEEINGLEGRLRTQGQEM